MNAGKQSFRLPLGAKIFLALLFLITLSLLIVVGFTYKVGLDIANASATEALDKNVRLHQKFRDADVNELSSVVFAFSSDPNVVGYIADSLNAGEDSAIDVNSIFDLAEERKSDTGLDFVIVLDADADLVVHSEKPGLRRRPYAKHPLVQPVFEELVPEAGIWVEGDKVYQAVVTPLDLDQDLIGFVVAGVLIDDFQAAELKQAGGANIVFLLSTELDYAAVGSTFDEATTLAFLSKLKERSPYLGGIQENIRVPLRTADGLLAVEVVPLTDPYSKEGRPLLLIVSSVDEFLDGYRKVLDVVVVAGALAIALALALSFVLSRQILRPVKHLAEAAEAASTGDYDADLGLAGKDEFAQLSNAFDNLLGNLRDKRDMQTFLAKISDTSPESEDISASSTVARKTILSSADTVLLAIAFESAPAMADEHSPFANVAAVISQAAEVGDRYHASLRLAGGDMLVFALASGSTIWLYSVLQQFRAELEPVLGASATGLKCVIAEDTSCVGNVELNQVSVVTMLGKAPKHLLRLLQETQPGQCLVTPKVYQNVKHELARAGIAAQSAKGRLTGKAFCNLDLTAGSKLDVPAPAWGDDLTQTLVSTPSSSAKMHPMLPKRYEVLGLLGSGAMGNVYKAQDLELNCLVALKVLTVDSFVSSEALDQIKSEITLARKITHQNILRTFDFGDAGGRPFISMEYVRGMTLAYLIQAMGRIPYSAALKVARQLCMGLQAVHDIGVLHRDIKPSNVILEPNGNVKLMDFGIACQQRDASLDSGMFIGTPRYASPEQIQGSELDFRSDVFACGLVITEMFTGKLPHSVRDYHSVREAQENGEYLKPSELWADIPAELDELLQRCFTMAAAERISSVGELLAALNQLKA